MNPKAENFLQKIKPAAVNIQSATGIPWMFAATQAAHESALGLSRLTMEANNLFGITGDSWVLEGKPVYWIITKEYAADQTPFEIKRPFRKYANWEESLGDWAELLKRRYSQAYAAALAGDFEAFAHWLQSGGYATDPNYATELVALHKELEGTA